MTTLELILVQILNNFFSRFVIFLRIIINKASIVFEFGIAEPYLPER